MVAILDEPMYERVLMGLQDMLERAGVRVMLNELSSTVVFERPQEEPFVRKWQLACQVTFPFHAFPPPSA